VTPFQWQRLQRLGARLVHGRAASLQQQAHRQWTLAPAESTTIPPAIYDPAHCARIRRLSPWRNQRFEDLLREGGSLRHAASTAYAVRNATLAGSHLYCGPAKHQCGPSGDTWFSKSERLQLAEAHLAATFASTHSFANFVLDELSLQMAIPEGALQIGAVGNHFEHSTGYRQLLQLPSILNIPFAQIQEITIYEDYAQHSAKRARYQQLRSRLRTTLAPTHLAPPPGVFLDRGETGERRWLTNSEAIRDALAARGFLILQPWRMSTEAILATMLDAPMVVGVEGSHLSHAAYTLAEHGCFLVLQPPDRFAMTYKEFTDCMSMRFAFLVGIPTQDGFEVPVEELLRMLDRLAA